MSEEEIETPVEVEEPKPEVDLSLSQLAGLGAVITIGLDDLTSASNTWDLAVEASYSSDGIKPYFELSVDSAGDTMPFTAGLELTTIDNLTTTLAYTSTNLTGDSPDKGDITAALKIAY